MKKILLLLLFVPLFSNAQISTSEEEYTYLTEGMKEQYSKGLDVKKDGYSLDKFFDRKSKSGKVNYVFSKFVDSKGTTKAISIVVKTPDAKPTDGIYYCYPINNEKLLKKHLKKIKSFMAEDDFIIVNSEAVIELLKR